MYEYNINSELIDKVALIVLKRYIDKNINIEIGTSQIMFNIEDDLYLISSQNVNNLNSNPLYITSKSKKYSKEEVIQALERFLLENR